MITNIKQLKSLLENNMITSIKEYKETIKNIRISSAGLCNIKIDGKYLLLLNKAALKRNQYIYTPIGGAIEFDNNAKLFLDTIVSKYERDTPDLRFIMNKNNLSKYETWFYNRVDREITVGREIIEELKDETKILKNIDASNFTEKYIKTVKDIEFYNNINNYRYFEIFDIVFSKEIIQQLTEYMNNSNLLYLATDVEILNNKTKTNIEIGNNANALL
jgi:hypothetical protein